MGWFYYPFSSLLEWSVGFFLHEPPMSPSCILAYISWSDRSNGFFLLRHVETSRSNSSMSLLFYRRPDYVEKSHGPMSASNYQKYLEKQQAAIPSELCFENVVANRAIPASCHARLSSGRKKLIRIAMFVARFHGIFALRCP